MLVTCHCYRSMNKLMRYICALCSAFCTGIFVYFREGYYKELETILTVMRSHAVSATHMALYYLCQAEINITLSKNIR